jgi:MurNAc alpha-1-phosphate uridylyltransferase
MSTPWTPEAAMILAAGLGTRMRPLTSTVPKPLVEVAGRTLLDHALDRLDEAGVRRAVVNVHWLAERMVDHVARRAARGRGPEVLISDESDRLLDSGGGVLKALPLLGAAPFLVMNSDVLWREGLTLTLPRLFRHWDAAHMDALLLMAPTVSTVGYDGLGDFNMEADGTLVRRPETHVAPFVFAGVQILSPALFEGLGPEPFSLNRVYDRAAEAGRLRGVRLDGRLIHVGTVASIAEADDALAERV